jgi:hypothetical protein
MSTTKSRPKFIGRSGRGISVTIPKLGGLFQTNPNKDFVRSSYDKPPIQEWRRLAGTQLRYLGLPAWEMLDIIEWQEFLERFTTIEREENQQHLMFLRANVKDVEHRLYSLYGEFDEILLTGRDSYGHSPEWPYDLVNLDYVGGFIYPNLSRPKAVRKLIENQAAYERSFMLIVTQQLRDKDSIGEKDKFLQDLRQWLKAGIHHRSMHRPIDKLVDWYRDADIPDAARQGLYMNFFFRDSGEMEHFDVKCRPAVIYPGTGGAWMIHLVTEFRYRAGTGHRAASRQSLVEMINLGLLEARDAEFVETRPKQPKLPIGT